MKTKLTLAAAALVLVTGPAFAIDDVVLYDAPQQMDAFFQFERGLVPDVTVTGSIAAPVVSAETPFWSAHEATRIASENNR